MREKAMKRILYLVICICLLSSCDTAEATEEDFVRQMRSLSPTQSPLYVQVEDMNDMIATTKTNCIIQCTLDSRDTSVVFDPFTGYKTEDLFAQDNTEEEKRVVSNYISTPYQITVQDVYLGDYFEKGDVFTFYAPYGEIGEYHCKVSGHPILQVGKTYLLFLRADKINGEFVYYLSYPPEGALEMRNDDMREDGVHAYDATVIEELKQNVERYSYDTSYDILATNETVR